MKSGDRGNGALAFRSPLCASGGMADASASGAGVRKGVGVQVPPRAREIPCCAGGPAGSPASTLDGAAKFVARPVVDDQVRIAQQLTLRDVRREGEVDRF